MTLGLCLLLAALGGAPFVAAFVGWKMGQQLSARRKQGSPRAPRQRAPGSAVTGELTPTAMRAIDRQLHLPGR